MIKRDKLRRAGIYCLIACIVTPACLADRIIIDNGDQISGQITSMTEGVLTIRTSYADSLSINWAHVTSVTTDKPITVRLSNNDVMTGTLSASKEGLAQLASEKLQEPMILHGNTIVAMGEAAAAWKPPASRWQGNVDLGFVEMSGNTEKTSVNISVAAAKESKKDRLEASSGVNYGQTEGQEDTQKGYIAARYSLYHTDKFFSYYESAMEYDGFQSLDSRSKIGLGVGRRFINTDTTKLNCRIGGLWINEDYEAPLPDDSYGAVSVGLNLTRQLRRNLVFVQKFSFDMSIEDTDNSLLTSESGLRTDLSDRLSISILAVDKYDNNPPANLEKNDLTLTTSLGYRF